MSQQTRMIVRVGIVLLAVLVPMNLVQHAIVSLPAIVFMLAWMSAGAYAVWHLYDYDGTDRPESRNDDSPGR